MKLEYQNNDLIKI